MEIKIIVVAQSKWGRGSTITEARSLGKIKATEPQLIFAITHLPDAYEEPYIDQMGHIMYHQDAVCQEIFRSKSLEGK